MKKYFNTLCLITVFLISTSVYSHAQTKGGGKASKSSHPKLFVGIVVDQMRWDYLYRY